MKFLKITNRGTVHRKLLELIGFSTKRELFDDLSIIGSKGSGTKLSVPAALRLGLTVWYCSSDEDGPYVLGYKTQEVSIGDGKKVKQIFFSYGDDKFIPTQLVLESFADWDKPLGSDHIREFKVVRELLANAQDADTNFRIDVVDAKSDEYCGAERDKTCVYISMTRGIAEMVASKSERYFKFLSKEKPLYEVPGVGAIYQKSSDDTRVFLQGVLVECNQSLFNSSLFDYSISDKTLLSEERTVKSHHSFYQKLAELVLSIPSVEFMKNLIVGIVEGQAEFEASFLYYLPSEVPEVVVSSLRTAWRELVGENGILASNDRLLDEDARNQGYEVISFSKETLRKLLLKVGIKQSSDVVTRTSTDIKEVEQLTPEEHAILVAAKNLLLYFFPSVAKYPIKVFETGDQKLNWNGFAGGGETIYKEIWIARKRIRQGSLATLQTLDHERRHCDSREQDFTVGFQKQADIDMAGLMVANGPPKFVREFIKYKNPLS